MCQLCETEAEILVDNFLPGWFLEVARKTDDQWEAGQYGLVRQNNAEIIFSNDLSDFIYFYDESLIALEKSGREAGFNDSLGIDFDAWLIEKVKTAVRK